MKTVSFLGVFLLCSLTAAQWEITPPEMTLLEGGGLGMAIDGKFLLNRILFLHFRIYLNATEAVGLSVLKKLHFCITVPYCHSLYVVNTVSPVKKP